MKFWKLLARWIARKALAEERDRLERYAAMVGREMSRVPARGTATEFRAAIRETCEATLPLGITLAIDFRDSDDVEWGHVRIVVEQSSGFGPRRAA